MVNRVRQCWVMPALPYIELYASLGAYTCISWWVGSEVLVDASMRTVLHASGQIVKQGGLCWVQSNPNVQDWMRANSLGSLSQLETYFESRVLDLATLAGRSYIVWQVPFVTPFQT